LSVASRGDARDFVPLLVICMGSGADRPSESLKRSAVWGPERGGVPGRDRRGRRTRAGRAV